MNMQPAENPSLEKTLVTKSEEETAASLGGRNF
jgi:hypothetical protein